jgi:hypothetical protein
LIHHHVRRNNLSKRCCVFIKSFFLQFYFGSMIWICSCWLLLPLQSTRDGCIVYVILLISLNFCFPINYSVCCCFATRF